MLQMIAREHKNPVILYKPLAPLRGEQLHLLNKISYAKNSVKLLRSPRSHHFDF